MPTVLHLDMDAFYASVEQAAKPSLRGKPVVVGGLGSRGVVATASYEARRYGVHSAMATAHARRLCPHAAYLAPRFTAYRAISEQVMRLLRLLSPLVEPLSLDEAFVDLEAGVLGPLVQEAGPAEVADAAYALAVDLRADIHATTGLAASVGLAGSKMLAKIASEEAKPDGLVLIPPGSERDLLAPMPVRILPGVGPATAEHLRRAGMTTVAEVAEAGEAELVRLLGSAHGSALYAMALGADNRPVVAEREAKSVSVEDTFEVDLADRTRVRAEIDRLARRCAERLRAAGRSGRTIVLKVRRYDFSTLTRSETLRAPTDDPGVVREIAQRLLDGVDTTGGVRLLGVGVSGLADYAQEDLFAHAGAEAAAPPGADARSAGEGKEADSADAPGQSGGRPRPGRFSGSGTEPQPHTMARLGTNGHPGTTGHPGAAQEPGRAAGAAESPESPPVGEPPAPGGTVRAPLSERRWYPGQDVRHHEYGPGWVQGSGTGRVTVRFEQPDSPPGRARTFLVDDPALQPAEPLPLCGALNSPRARPGEAEPGAEHES